jgi:hypothetical protein
MSTDAQASHYVARADLRGIEIRHARAHRHRSDAVGGLVSGLRVAPVRVLTGVAMGPVHVTVEPLQVPRGIEPGWQDVVEVSLEAGREPVVVAGPFEGDPPPELRLDSVGPGWYRFRVHACDRDAEFDGVATRPRERYLLQSWPAGPTEPVALATGSRFATSWARTQQWEPPTPPAVVLQPVDDAHRRRLLEESSRRHRERHGPPVGQT